MAIGQGRVSALALVVVVCALAGASRCAQAVQHQVGGPPGWSLPSRSNVNYTLWATMQKFVVGDTLYFNYSKERHNVLEVTKANYESCTASNPLFSRDDGATIIPLNKTGTFYYICGIPTHCSLGQELAVNVLTGSASAAAPTPSSASAVKWMVSTFFAVAVSYLGIFSTLGFTPRLRGCRHPTRSIYPLCLASSTQRDL